MTPLESDRAFRCPLSYGSQKVTESSFRAPPIFLYEDTRLNKGFFLSLSSFSQTMLGSQPAATQASQEQLLSAPRGGGQEASEEGSGSGWEHSSPPPPSYGQSHHSFGKRGSLGSLTGPRRLNWREDQITEALPCWHSAAFEGSWQMESGGWLPWKYRWPAQERGSCFRTANETTIQQSKWKPYN